MITFEEVAKTYPGASAPVVDGVSLAVPTGETCVLLGPSGCGKTTLLKMVNRLIPKTGGRILVGGQDVDQLDPTELRRGIGYAIQQVGLFPNMTVEQNVRVVPDLLGWDRRRSRDRAAELMAMLALDEALLARYPAELSGGQAQRVGVARALAADPPVLLMDEPFGAVDPVNRASIQAEFVRLQRRLRKTVLFVSHDIEEALTVGDRIAILRAGRLVQYDRPGAMLARPADAFVRGFVGGDRVLRLLRLLKAGDALAEPGGVKEAPAGADDRIGPEDDLRTAASRMLERGLASLPCVDADGALLGHVTQAGIARALRRGADDLPSRAAAE